MTIIMIIVVGLVLIINCRLCAKQAGFRTGRRTTEQIFNLRIICEKYLQHQQDLYHVFIDFKKAFDRVWHAALWTIMRQYNTQSQIQDFPKEGAPFRGGGVIAEIFRALQKPMRFGGGGVVAQNVSFP